MVESCSTLPPRCCSLSGIPFRKNSIGCAADFFITQEMDFEKRQQKSRLHRHQKSAGAWLSLQNDVLCNRLLIQSRVLLSTAPASRTKGVVEQFGTSGVPIPCRMKPTYGGTLVFSCATIIQIHHLSVKFLNVSHCIRNFKKQFSTGDKKDPSTG